MVVPALVGGLGAPELLLILVLVLVLFGAGRLPQVFSQLGSAMKNFRDAQREGDDAIDVEPPRRLSEHDDAQVVNEKAKQKEKA